MVDNTIALQVRPFQMPDVGQIYGQAQTLQANRMRMEEAQETARERNALRGLVASGVDLNTPEGLAQLRRTAPMLAPQFEQAASQRAYQRAQISRIESQNDREALQTAQTFLPQIRTPEQWAATRPALIARFPQYAHLFRPEYSPELIRELALGAESLRTQYFSRDDGVVAVQGGRATTLPGTAPTPRPEFVMIEGAPFVRVREGNTYRLRPALQGDEPATTAAAPTTPAPAGAARAPANAFAAPAAPVTPVTPVAPAAPAAAAPAPTAAAPAATQPMLPRTPAEARARAIEQEEAKAGARETGQLRARSRDQATNDLTVMTEALSIIDSITTPRRDMPDGNSLLRTATGSFAGAARDLAFRGAGWETASNNAALALEAQQAALVSLLPRMRGDLNRAEFDSLMAQAAKIGDRTQTYDSRLLALNTVRDRLSRLQQRLATQAGVELPPTPAPAPVTPPPATGAQGATPRIRPDGRTARITGQQGSASTTATPGAEAPPVPPGVEATPEEWGLLWSVMPERERALWRRN
jgi:hypothetical protein